MHISIILIVVLSIIHVMHCCETNKMVLIANQNEQKVFNLTCITHEECDELTLDGPIDPKSLLQREKSGKEVIEDCDGTPPENWIQKSAPLPISYFSEDAVECETENSESKRFSFKNKMTFFVTATEAYVNLNQNKRLVLKNDEISFVNLKVNKIVETKKLTGFQLNVEKRLQLIQDDSNNLRVLVEDGNIFNVNCDLKFVQFGSEFTAKWRIIENGQELSKYWWTNKEIKTPSFLVDIPKDGNKLCVSFRVSFCKTCIMYVALMSNDVIKTYKMLEHDGNDWMNVELELKSHLYQNYTLAVGTERLSKSESPFWAIDEIQYCKNYTETKITTVVDNLVDYKCRLKDNTVKYTKPQPFANCLTGLYKNVCRNYLCHSKSENGTIFCFGYLGENVCYCSEGFGGTYCHKRTQASDQHTTMITITEEKQNNFAAIVVLCSVAFFALLLFYVFGKCIKNVFFRHEINITIRNEFV